jgi:hypothetical protein
LEEGETVFFGEKLSNAEIYEGVGRYEEEESNS